MNERMIRMAENAEAKYGDAYAILLMPNVGDSSSPIYTYGNCAAGGTPWNQAQREIAEAYAIRDMVGLVVIESCWDEEKQDYVCTQYTVED